MLTCASLFLFFMAVCLIFSERKHFLSVLLAIELLSLSIYFLACSLVMSGVSTSGVNFGLVFLVFRVYEAANGLGLLVGRARGRGVDQLTGLFSLRF